ncbi:MAG: UDP-N-acetylmuramate dehydrogenase [Deltaproteobacteria bacterium]|nr:UDP-N-acetylmuramate dehydrogenase [Deltaproteobacteria bacterium]
MKIEKNIDLSSFTTINIGSKGNLIWLENTQDFKILCELKEKLFLLGNGSKLLLSNNIKKYIFVKLGKNFSYVHRKDNKIIVGGSTTTKELIKWCIENEIQGLEFLAGIPGTMAGIVSMNGGAFGECIADFLQGVKIYNRSEEAYLSKQDLNPTYRHIDINEETIIYEIYLKNFRKGKTKEIIKIVDSFLNRRKNSIPQQPSLGCIFKNPKDAPAGFLIEKVGLKGYMIGDAQISLKHANIFINRGKATFEDVMKLIELAHKMVYDKFGIFLEREVIIP